jgi:hypothetical protein
MKAFFSFGIKNLQAKTRTAISKNLGFYTKIFSAMWRAS